MPLIFKTEVEIEPVERPKDARWLKPHVKSMRSTAKGFAPVDTGALRDSIEVEELKNASGDITGYDVVAGDEEIVDYASYQEEGTKYQSGQPFMKPAYDREERKINKTLERLFR